MKRRALVLLLGVLGCGAPAAEVPLGVAIQGLSVSEIAAVQITVLANADHFICDQLRTTCLRDSLEKSGGTSSIVRVKGADGKEVNALRVKLDGTNLLSPSGQLLEVHMPAGTKYMVVAEVMGPQAQLLASGCGVLDQVSNGDNRGLTIQTFVVTGQTCDPRID